MAVRLNGTATVPASLQTDITTIRTNVATILSRVTGSVALDADMQTLLARVTASRAGYWDNLNIGGLVASAADLTTVLTTVGTLIVAPQTIETGVFSFAAGTNGTPSAWQELIASSAAAVWFLSFKGMMTLPVNSQNVKIAVQIGTGAGGSEVVKGNWRGIASAEVTSQSFNWDITILEKFPAGTRIAIRAVNEDSVGASTCLGGYNVCET